MAQLRKLRFRFHKINPNCCYCGRETTLQDWRNNGMRLRPQPNAATIEHIKSKWDGMIEGRNKVANLTLACYECNHARGHKQEKEWFKQNGFKASNYHPHKKHPMQNWFDSWDRDLNRFDCF